MRGATWILAAALSAAALLAATGCVTRTETGLIQDLGTMPPASHVPGEDPLETTTRIRVEDYLD